MHFIHRHGKSGSTLHHSTANSSHKNLMIFLNEHSPSILAKVFMSLGVFSGATWGIILASGYAGGNSYRILLVFICCFLYFLRFTITLFAFLKRKINWGESGLVTVLFFMMFYFFCSSAAVYQGPIGAIDFFGTFLFLFGSWLNMTSDYQRYKWKKITENKGRLYTSGLFSYAMHINYFGDALAYLGIALITHQLGCMAISIGMFVYFIIFEIPRLDEHLSMKYMPEFEQYAGRTKKFIPFIY